MIEKLLSPSSKENGSIVIGKLENCLEDHYHVLVLCFLDHGDTLVIVIVIHLAYGGYFFAKGLSNYAKVLSFCMKMPGVIHPTGQLFMAVHLMFYGSVPFLHSVFYLLLNP